MPKREALRLQPSLLDRIASTVVKIYRTLLLLLHCLHQGVNHSTRFDKIGCEEESRKDQLHNPGTANPTSPTRAKRSISPPAVIPNKEDNHGSDLHQTYAISSLREWATESMCSELLATATVLLKEMPLATISTSTSTTINATAVKSSALPSSSVPLLEDLSTSLFVIVMQLAVEAYSDSIIVAHPNSNPAVPVHSSNLSANMSTPTPSFPNDTSRLAIGLQAIQWLDMQAKARPSLMSFTAALCNSQFQGKRISVPPIDGNANAGKESLGSGRSDDTEGWRRKTTVSHESIEKKTPFPLFSSSPVKNVTNNSQSQSQSQSHSEETEIAFDTCPDEYYPFAHVISAISVRASYLHPNAPQSAAVR